MVPGRHRRRRWTRRPRAIVLEEDTAAVSRCRLVRRGHEEILVHVARYAAGIGRQTSSGDPYEHAQYR